VSIEHTRATSVRPMPNQDTCFVFTAFSKKVEVAVGVGTRLTGDLGNHPATSYRPHAAERGFMETILRFLNLPISLSALQVV
jgi:hypothetical protein